MAKSEILTCRRILSLVAFLGFMIHHMLRVNISIAIVEMVAKNDTNSTLGPRYNWNEEEKNDIMGYFFWGYVLTQIPGGRLSEKFGSKVVLGVGILSASILTLLVPVASQLGHYWLIVARFFLGVAVGVHFPSTHPIASRWIPPEDTSTFMSHMTASSLGVAVTLPVCGYLLAYWGWPSVFYVTGSIAFVWSLSWFYLIYDTPDQHPRISPEEKNNLKEKIKPVKYSIKTKIPWVKMLTSGAVWAVIMGNTCGSCTFFIAFNQLPTYMSQVLHFNIEQNGWFSSLPYLVRYFMSFASSIIADKLFQSKILSKTNIRKLFSVTFFAGSCILFAIQALWGNSGVVCITVFTVCLGLMGFLTPGVHTNPIDIAPAYSGTIYGISQVPSAIGGYVTTKIVALITRERQDFEQWAYVFWILVGLNLFAAIFALIFTSGEEQSWSLKSDEREMVKLKSENVDKV